MGAKFENTQEKGFGWNTGCYVVLLCLLYNGMFTAYPKYRKQQSEYGIKRR